MNKPLREWWIKTCDYIPNRAVETYEHALCTSGCTHSPIRVREVDPTLDAAVEVLVEALEMADKALGRLHGASHTSASVAWPAIQIVTSALEAYKAV